MYPSILPTCMSVTLKHTMCLESQQRVSVIPNSQNWSYT